MSNLLQMKVQARHVLSMLAVAGTANFVAVPAVAQLVTFEFTGTVTSASGSPLGLTPSAGDPVQGTFAYDLSLPPSFDTGTVAGYIQPLPSGMSLNVSGVDVESTGSASFQVLNNAFGVDNLNGFFSSVLKDGQPVAGQIGFSLSDNTQTAFSSTALPADLEVSSFNSRTGFIFGDGSIFISIDTLKKPATLVAIDIKPGGFPNPINPRSRGVIPVAVLTTMDFDATTVDPTTVLFGPTGTEAAPVQDAWEDVDGNGEADLILHFDTWETAIACGDVSATLTGATFDGEEVTGSDDIVTVGCH